MERESWSPILECCRLFVGKNQQESPMAASGSNDIPGLHDPSHDPIYQSERGRKRLRVNGSVPTRDINHDHGCAHNHLGAAPVDNSCFVSESSEMRGLYVHSSTLDDAETVKSTTGASSAASKVEYKGMKILSSFFSAFFRDTNHDHGCAHNHLGAAPVDNSGSVSESSEMRGLCGPSSTHDDDETVKSTTGASLAASKVEYKGTKILSSFFSTFSTPRDTFKSGELEHVTAKVSQRLVGDSRDAAAASVLAKILINMTASDNWLLKHIQSNDFDGTWVAIICNLYQRLYLYDTQIIQRHDFLSAYNNNSLLSKGKLMISLFRVQHMRIFQRLITQQICKENIALSNEDEKKINIIEILGNEELLVSTLLISIQQTIYKIQRWAKQQLGYEAIGDNNGFSMQYNNERITPLLRRLLACVLHNILDYGEGLQDDKWLYKLFQNLDETPNLLDSGNWSMIICALFQALYLYHTDSVIIDYLSFDDDHCSLLAKERLTVLIFRSQNLQIFQSILVEKLGNHETFNVHTNPLKYLLMSSLLESLQQTSISIQAWAKDVFADSKRYSKTSEDSKDTCLNDENNMKSNIHFTRDTQAKSKSKLKQPEVSETMSMDCATSTSVQLLIQHFSPHSLHGSDSQHEVQNVFLGSNSIPNNWKIDDLIDLKFVHALGGLICTIIGNSNDGEESGCTSWCIIRHEATCLLFCVELKDDVFRNKSKILNGTSIIDYEGLLEVTATDGKTFVKSFEMDGSSYFGDLEDFADVKHQKTHKSCAAQALHTLPQSDILEKSTLKCSALHLLAFAFLVGNKECLMFNWAGGFGHIQYNSFCENVLSQSQDATNCALQKCNVLYTHEGKLIGRDVIWNGDPGYGAGYWHDPVTYPGREQSGYEGPSPSNEPPTPPEDGDKVAIVLEHRESWIHHECSTQDFQIDADQIQRSLAKARKELEQDLVPEVVAVLAALKRNGGGGFGAFGWKLEGHLEWRPAAAEELIKNFLHERIVQEYHKKTIVVHPELHNDKFHTLQVQFKNGTIAEHPEEFFVVKTNNSCCMQIYLYIHEPETFVWLTDLVVANTTTVRRIFEKNLKGKSLTISRSNSLMEMHSEIQPQSFAFARLFHQVQHKFQSQQRLVTTETMVSAAKLEGFPPSKDEWNLIVGQQREFNNKDCYLKVKEIQALICGATYYTTGGAILRTKKQMEQQGDTIQPSTNSSSIPLYYGSCKRVCTTKFHLEEHKVEATGKFSTFKGISNSSVVYWG